MGVARFAAIRAFVENSVGAATPVKSVPTTSTQSCPRATSWKRSTTVPRARSGSAWRASSVTPWQRSGGRSLRASRHEDREQLVGVRPGPDHGPEDPHPAVPAGQLVRQPHGDGRLARPRLGPREVERPHRSSPPHVQALMSGRSARCSRIQVSCSASRASHRATRSCHPRGRAVARRSTSLARWNRLIRLSTTMSNGVVVVPCSEKPRTWKRPGFERPCTSWCTARG